MALTKPKPSMTIEKRDGRLPPKKEKEIKAVEIATEVLVELYGPALKELEKH